MNEGTEACMDPAHLPVHTSHQISTANPSRTNVHQEPCTTMAHGSGCLLNLAHRLPSSVLKQLSRHPTPIHPWHCSNCHQAIECPSAMCSPLLHLEMLGPQQPSAPALHPASLASPSAGEPHMHSSPPWAQNNQQNYRVLRSTWRLSRSAPLSMSASPKM